MRMINLNQLLTDAVGWADEASFARSLAQRLGIGSHDAAGSRVRSPFVPAKPPQR